jgi:hypothetical protein
MNEVKKSEIQTGTVVIKALIIAVIFVSITILLAKATSSRKEEKLQNLPLATITLTSTDTFSQGIIENQPEATPTHIESPTQTPTPKPTTTPKATPTATISPTRVPEVSGTGLFFSPSNSIKGQGETFILNIMLNVKDQKIGFASVKLLFDKNILSVTNIRTNPEMNMIVQKTSPNEANFSGIIEITIGVSAGETNSAPSGLVNLASLEVSGINRGVGNFSFDQKSVQITSLDATMIPVSVSGATFTIN